MSHYPYYLGITGVTCAADVDTLRACSERLVASGVPLRLMAGVLVSHKTLSRVDVTSRRYPRIDDARELLGALGEFAWPVVHYNTRSTGPGLRDELMDLAAALPAMRGLQLNIVRPEPRAVFEFAIEHRSDVEVILQINGRSLDEQTPAAVRDYIRRYRGIRHALVDMSGGTGRPVDADWACDAMSVARSATRHVLDEPVLPGVAGGFGQGSDDIIATIWCRNGLCSIDAESGLRVPVDDPIDGARHQDRLERYKALEYVEGAINAYGELEDDERDDGADE